jgi:hypothetical protein
VARKTLNFTISDEGRDKGKVFVLTEWPAAKAERWAMRALLALMNGGVEIPDGFEHLGMAALAELGIKTLAGLKWEVAEPLLGEMWDAVQFMPDPARPQIVRAVFEGDIEEVATRIALRAEVWKIHADFLKAVVPSKPGKASTAP